MNESNTEAIAAFRDQTGAVTRLVGSSQRVFVETSAHQLPHYSHWLQNSGEFKFATLVAETGADSLTLKYLFYPHQSTVLLELGLELPSNQLAPSISHLFPAADWHERQIEDLYGIRFSGHPFLGDFMLHDEEWPEGVGPMLPGFDQHSEPPRGGTREQWRPHERLDEEGAFELPVGPIWGDTAESALYLLESPGEEIRLAHSRLFYKYRGIEKIAEGQRPEEVLLIAERASGNAAFAHAIAFCQVIEELGSCHIPPRAQSLRLVFSELERMRWHMGVISELCGATGLSIGRAVGEELTEKLLRLSQVCTGHRYLFGVARIGGLARDLDKAGAEELMASLPKLRHEISRYASWLRGTSSFLDRIEQVGALTHDLASSYGLVGPVARACNLSSDLRWVRPYGLYGDVPEMAVSEAEGDGYARLRVFLREIECSAELIIKILSSLPEGPVYRACPTVAGAGLGWAEAPAGAAFHWVRLGEDNSVLRWHVSPPSFRNFQALHRAVEGAAFQDFPIILASFGLSIAENDC